MSSRKDRRRSTSTYYYNKNHDMSDNYQNANSSKQHRRRSEIKPEEKRSVSPCVEPERKDDRKEISAQPIKWEKNRPNDTPSTSSRSASKKLPIRTEKDADYKKQTQVAVTNTSKGQNSPKVNPILEKDTKHDRENWAKSPAVPNEPVVTIENSRQFDDSSQESSISGTLNESQFEFSPIECPEIQSIKIPASIEFQNQAELEINDSRHFRKWAENRAREHDENDDAILRREAKNKPLVDKVNLQSSSDLSKERDVIEKLKKKNTFVLKALYAFGKELNHLKQKMERFEASRSPSRSRRSPERSVQSCERRRRSLRHSSSRESSQSQNSAHSHERRELFEASKSLNRSCGSHNSRKETSVSKRTSTDRAYERRTRSQSRSSSGEINQSQDRSHSRERNRSRSGSHSRKRDLSSNPGHQNQPTQNSWRSRTPGRRAPSPPAHWDRPRIRSDKAGTNIKSMHVASPGIVDKEQNCYESKAGLDPEKLTTDPDHKTINAPKKATPSEKPNQNEPPECVDLQKFPYEEYEFIGDSLSFYLANVVSKVTENVSKPYLKEQIHLTELYKSIKPVTFAKSKAIVSMAQYELNFSRLENEKLQEMVEEVVDLLIEKGFEKIIVLFPLVKPVAGNQKPVSMKQYFAYRHIFESVCDQRQIPFWWTPSALFLQHDENELKFDKDNGGDTIPIKCKFNYRKSSGKLKFYPEMKQKDQVLVEMNKLYNSKPIQTVAALKTKKKVEITKEKSHEVVTGPDGKRYLVCKQVTCKTTTTELPEIGKALFIEESASDVPDLQLSPEWYQKPEANADAKSVTSTSLVTDSTFSKASSETAKNSSSSQSFRAENDTSSNAVILSRISIPPPNKDDDLQKFPYDEFELIGDSLSYYLANVVWKVTANQSKPYLKEHISLTDLYKSIEPVTFTKSKAIVSMAQLELNFTTLYNKTVQKKVKKVVDLLIEKGFEKIIILFPLIKPHAGNQKPVSMSSYFVYRRIFELVCDYKRVTLWWSPAAVFLQLKKDEKRPGKMKFDQDDDGNMIPIKCKFYRHNISGKFYPGRNQKKEVLVEIDKLYRNAYFLGKRSEMYLVEE